MKNESSFLAMQEILLTVVATMRHGITALNDNSVEPLDIARDWIGIVSVPLITEADIQGYTYYTHVINEGKVMVIGVQEEGQTGDDPDKLFFCEVIRLSTTVVESWVRKGKPDTKFFTENEVVELWAETMERDLGWTDFTDKLNKRLKERWL